MVRRNIRLEERNHTPELEQALELHERGWKVRQRSLIFLVCCVFASLTIILSGNIFRNQDRRSSGVSIQYEHLLQRNTEMTVLFKCEGTEALKIVAIPLQYLKNFRLERIFPEPTERIISRGKVLYRFNNSMKQDVAFSFTAKTTGSVEESWWINDGNVRFSHFIYP